MRFSVSNMRMVLVYALSSTVRLVQHSSQTACSLDQAMVCGQLHRPAAQQISLPVFFTRQLCVPAIDDPYPYWTTAMKSTAPADAAVAGTPHAQLCPALLCDALRAAADQRQDPKLCFQEAEEDRLSTLCCWYHLNVQSLHPHWCSACTC